MFYSVDELLRRANHPRLVETIRLDGGDAAEGNFVAVIES